MKNYVEIGKKGSDGHTENTRLVITLSNTDSDIYRSVNYRKMVASENGSGNVEFLEMEDPHDRFKDYEEDSYIDNSELLRDTYPPGQEPENLGFFINFGKLKLKTQRSKSTAVEDRLKKRKKLHEKERKQSKLEKHSKWSSLHIPSSSHRLIAECGPSFSPAQGMASMTNSEEFVAENSDYLGKAERKKLKLLRKEEKKIRKNLEKVKSPTEKKKKIDPNLALDKILMARMKKVKHGERKIINPSSNYMFLPGFQAGPFPFFNIKP